MITKLVHSNLQLVYVPSDQLIYHNPRRFKASCQRLMTVHQSSATVHSFSASSSHVRIATFIFLSVPLIEMIILIEVGSIIGAVPTVGLVVLTAVCGIWLLRLEGMATLARVQQKLAAGELPGEELLEGVMLLIGGALLLTPGFATDLFGFICLIPIFRRPLAVRIIESSVFRAVNVNTGRTFFYQQGKNRGHTIDGEFDVQREDTGKDVHSLDQKEG